MKLIYLEIYLNQISPSIKLANEDGDVWWEGHSEGKECFLAELWMAALLITPNNYFCFGTLLHTFLAH